MEVVYPCCCGLDVHKKSITACVLWADHFDRIDVNRIRRSLVRRLERRGHKVTLEPLALTA